MNDQDYEVGKIVPLDIILSNSAFIKSCVHYYIRGYDLVAIKVSSVSIQGVDPAICHLPVYYGPVLNITDDGVVNGFIG